MKKKYHIKIFHGCTPTPYPHSCNLKEALQCFSLSIEMLGEVLRIGKSQKVGYYRINEYKTTVVKNIIYTHFLPLKQDEIWTHMEFSWILSIILQS